MKAYYELTKPGIVKLVLITGLAGFGLGFQQGQSFNILGMIQFILGLTILSAGSLALNQTQEWIDDKKMNRTEDRPIPSGEIQIQNAYIFSAILILAGLVLLYFVNPMSMAVGFFTVVFYNLIYTLVLKKNIVFAAVPGAIPGAAPVVIGYSAAAPNIFNKEVLYLFLLMFLWQMPHFWALAIRYAEDYKRGGFPVLPAELGKKRTLLHMGLYLAPYILLALFTPFFIETYYFYYALVLPICLVVVYEFIRFCKTDESKSWLRFFLWINVSLLVYLISPLLDKWVYYYQKIGQYGN